MAPAHDLRPAKRRIAGFLGKDIRPTYGVALAVALVTVAAYTPALLNGFVEWDDYTYVVHNHFIRVLNAFFFKEAFFSFYAANWHPLTWLSHALDYKIWSLNPFGHHLTSVILHGMNAFLVVILATKLIKSAVEQSEKAAGYSSEKGVLVAAAITGLLFGIHPLHVESVAWVAERKDVLCAFFYLLSLIAYTNFSEAGRKAQKEEPGTVMSLRWYLAALLFLILSLMSKPMAVTLPIILLIIDWYPFRKFDEAGGFVRSLREKLPFLAFALASGAVTLLAQKAGFALVPMERIAVPVRIAVGFRSMLDYLLQMVFPLRLVPLYPYPRQVSFFSFAYSIPLLAVAAAAVFCVAEARKGRRLWAAACSCYAVMLSPVIGFVQVGAQAMANRYAYLPSLGPFFLAGIGCALVFDRYIRGRRLVFVGVVCVAALLLAFSTLLTLTRHQIVIGQNGITLWTREIKYEPGVLAAYSNRGIAFMDSGNYVAAVRDFTTIISLEGGNPGYLPFYNRARAFAYVGRTEDALKDATRAASISPESWQPYYIRGKVYMIANRYDEAIHDFSRGIRLNSSFSELYFNRAVSYFRTERYKDAISDLTSAINLNPGLRFRYYGNRGIVYEKMGISQKALDDFARALVIDPETPALLYRRGNLYLKTGDVGKALTDFTKAIELSGGTNPLYLSARSAAYKRLEFSEETKKGGGSTKNLPGFRGKR